MLDDDVAGELSRVGNDDMIRELAIVAEMSIRHNQVVVTYTCDAPAFGCPEVDADVFADSVVVADLERRPRGPIAVILRGTAKYGSTLNQVAVADAYAAETAANSCVRLDYRACADLDGSLDDAVRSDLNAIGDTRLY